MPTACSWVCCKAVSRASSANRPCGRSAISKSTPALRPNIDNFRANATYFYSWVVDDITFEGESVVDFFDAKLVRFINTPLGTYTGFEASGEWDLTPSFTPFAKSKYVQGQDEFLGGPLPGIPPLEGTVGLRWHDCSPDKLWQVEVGTRIVNQQNRLGEIIVGTTPTVVEERTGGFTTTYLRGEYKWTKDLNLVAGIDNVFNRAYQEHLDLRLLGPTGFPAPPTRGALAGHHALFRRRLEVLTADPSRAGYAEFAGHCWRVFAGCRHCTIPLVTAKPG